MGVKCIFIDIDLHLYQLRVCVCVWFLLFIMLMLSAISFFLSFRLARLKCRRAGFHQHLPCYYTVGLQLEMSHQFVEMDSLIELEIGLYGLI